MKTLKLFENNKIGIRAWRFIHGGMATAVVTLIGASWPSIGVAQEGPNEEQGVEVLTRGPVHEAFAGIVTYNPAPGVLVQKAPPAMLEEIPPSMRPQGNNITWIPGYWGWDDERSDYLWVSGTWRALPPGRQWMAGYWGETNQGHQWTSGYWADATLQETTYLPAPPATVEEGPSTRAPSRDYGWTPGNWRWQQERYAWSPGYWSEGRADWDWVPDHYVWTPRGYIYVDGYWDYPVQRRGTLFAPVYFNSGVYTRTNYSYTPSIVLGLAMFAEHLFVRPKYHHYYFGDYYANNYNRSGYYSSHSYQSTHYGYDPIYSRQRWEHREDQAWERRMQDNFISRRDHENERPPHTWSAMRRLETNEESTRNVRMMAAPIDQIVQSKDRSGQFQKVAKEDQTKLVERNREMRKMSSERRTIESTGTGPKSTTKPGEAPSIEKVKRPQSPIVAMPAAQFEKNQAPPAIPKAPVAKDGEPQPKLDPNDRQPKKDKKNPREVPEKPEIRDPSPPRKNNEAPRADPMPPARPTKNDGKTVPPTIEPPQKIAPPVVPPSPSNTKNREKKLPPTPEPRVKEEPERKTEQPTRKAPEKATEEQTPKGSKKESKLNPDGTEKLRKKDRNNDGIDDSTQRFDQ